MLNVNPVAFGRGQILYPYVSKIRWVGASTKDERASVEECGSRCKAGSHYHSFQQCGCNMRH